MEQTDSKDRLKALRKERREYIEQARVRIKESRIMIKAIKGQLATGPKTVPEMAAALGKESAKVLCFVAALKKYGEVVEGAKAGDYFTYASAD